MPEQELRIVNALKTSGEIVAMTGDGVNDAPSLKAAHIGIAMGGRGTDVAREASAIVLLDDDFDSIVTAVRLGRRIYDDLRKAMGFIFAVHAPIAGLALLPLVFGYPILFGPTHIAFLEMVIDPACALVFEAETEEADVMRHPPRSPEEPLFSGALIGWSLLQGATAFALVAGNFVVASGRGMPESEVRALTFVSLGSFRVRRHIGGQVWRTLHYASFVAFGFACVHGLALGTESTTAWATLFYLGTLAPVLFLCFYRVLSLKWAVRFAPYAGVMHASKGADR